MSQSWDYIAKLVCIGDSGTGKSSLTIRLCEGRFSPHHDVTIGVEFGSRIVPVGPPASLSLNINDPNSFPSTHTPTSTNPQEQQSQNPATPNSKPNSKPNPNSNPTSSPKQQPQKHMKLSLWDTAGQETYKSITRSYFRGASGALLVFDISRRETFDSVTAWLHDLRQIAEEGIIVILVGNKCDLAGGSLVSPPTRTGGGDTDDAGGGQQQQQNNNTGETPFANQKNKRAVTTAEATEWCARNSVLRYVETSAKSGEGVERAFLEVAERIYQNIEAGRYDLNDRRSGVKGRGAQGGSAGAGKGQTMRGRGDGTVVLGMNDVAGSNNKGGGWGGGCC